jgi:RNA binding exosome subunit
MKTDTRIKISDEFTISRDKVGWTLETTYDGLDKDKNPKKHTVLTYYGNLEQVCNSMIDRAAGSCETAKEILQLLKPASKLLQQQIQQ